MLEPIEKAAHTSVARACGFGLVAVGTLMIGMMGLPALAFKCGGLSLLLMTAILILKAMTVPNQRYSRTETWMILAKPDRPPPEVAQQIVSGVLRDVYLDYARFSALASGLLSCVGLLLSVTSSR